MKKPVVFVVLFALLACGPAPNQAAARTQAGQQPPGNLDSLLAPIALYPDSLLAQILMSAADPAAVTKLDQWLTSMKNVKGTQLQDAAVKAGFEPSFVALVLFP